VWVVRVRSPLCPSALAWVRGGLVAREAEPQGDASWPPHSAYPAKAHWTWAGGWPGEAEPLQGMRPCHPSPPPPQDLWACRRRGRPVKESPKGCVPATGGPEGWVWVVGWWGGVWCLPDTLRGFKTTDQAHIPKPTHNTDPPHKGREGSATQCAARPPAHLGRKSPTYHGSWVREGLQPL